MANDFQLIFVKGMANYKLHHCVPITESLISLEMRLNELSIVDRFVFAECTTDYNGQPKPLIYEENQDLFAKFAEKIDYIVVELPSGLSELEAAKFHYNKLLEGMSEAAPSDYVLFSEDSEILDNSILTKILPDCEVTFNQDASPLLFKLDYFKYYLNLKVTLNPELARGENMTFLTTASQFVPTYMLTENTNDNRRFPEIAGWKFEHIGQDGDIDMKHFEKVAAKDLPGFASKYHHVPGLFLK